MTMTPDGGRAVWTADMLKLAGCIVWLERESSEVFRIRNCESCNNLFVRPGDFIDLRYEEDPVGQYERPHRNIRDGLPFLGRVVGNCVDGRIPESMISEELDSLTGNLVVLKKCVDCDEFLISEGAFLGRHLKRRAFISIENSPDPVTGLYGGSEADGVCDCGQAMVRCRSCGRAGCPECSSYSEIGGNWYCSRCSFECQSCGERCGIDGSIAVHDGSRICQGCYDSHYFSCARCENVYHEDDACHGFDGNGEDDENQTLCPSCREALERRLGPSKGTIMDYGYKPAPKFKRQDKEDKPDGWKGFELEVEKAGSVTDRQDMANRMYEILGDAVYYKNDGSLDDGFEMVSHPMSARYWNKTFKPKLKKALSVLIKEGYRSSNTSTCGLHFHLSRTFFSGTIQLYKFLKLVYDSSNRSFIVKVSGRRKIKAMTYAKLSEPRTTSQDTILKKKAKDKFGFDRYQAVNLQNEKTVEVRFFKGTLNYSTFCARLQMISSMIEFSCAASISHTLNDYLAFIRENSQKYKRVYEYFKNVHHFYKVTVAKEGAAQCA
jgi:hypothetical protein